MADTRFAIHLEVRPFRELALSLQAVGQAQRRPPRTCQRPRADPALSRADGSCPPGTCLRVNAGSSRPLGGSHRWPSATRSWLPARLETSLHIALAAFVHYG